LRNSPGLAAGQAAGRPHRSGAGNRAGPCALFAVRRWDFGAPLAEDMSMHLPLRSLLLVATLMAASCTAPGMEGSAAARDPTVLGATGQTVVIGSSSSMAGSNRVHPDWGNVGVDAQRGD
jgi:hypothetical protein